jgi:hypothetical protein
MSQLSHELIDRVVKGTSERIAEDLRERLGRLELPPASGVTPAPLARAVHGMRGAKGQADTLRVLLAAASSLGARAALFVVRPGRLEGWSGVGFEDDPGLSSGLRGITLDPSEPAVRRALEEGRPVESATGSDAPVPDFGQAIRGEAVVVPLTISGRVAGLLYADPESGRQPLDKAGLEALVEIAGLAIERNVSGGPQRTAGDAQPAAHEPAAAAQRADTPAAPASTVAMPAAVAAQDSDSDPEGADAVRFARLLMEEICLYNADRVEEGRHAGDLASRLSDEIERARAMYVERISADVRARGDWFEQAMIAVLGAGDPATLGSTEKSSY